MADAPPFERGDIVVYKHKKNGMDWFDNSLGVITEVRSDSQVYVDWFAPVDYQRLKNVFKEFEPNHYAYNLEKVGHLDDF